MTAAPSLQPAHPVLAALAAAQEALAGAGQASAWSMTDADVVAGIEDLLAVQAQAGALAAGMVREARVRSLHTELNQSDTRRWLRRRFRLSAAEAARLDALAETLPRCPAVAAALAAGAITAEQGEVLARVLDRLPATATAAEREQATALLVEQAAILDPAELSRCGREIAERLTVLPDVDDPAEAAALEREARRQAVAQQLRARRRPDGTVAINAVYEALDGAEVLAGIEAHAARPRRAGQGDGAGPAGDGVPDPRTKAQRLADALHEIVVAAGLPQPDITTPVDTDSKPDPDPHAARAAEASATGDKERGAHDGDDADQGRAAGGAVDQERYDREYDDDLFEDALADNDDEDQLADDERDEEESDADESDDQAAVVGPGAADCADDEATAVAAGGQDLAGPAATGGGTGRRGVSTGAMPRPGAAQVGLVVQWDPLRGLRPRAGILDDGTVLAPSQLLRALCDAAVLPMVFAGPARPIRLGRRRRLFSTAQRAALAARDRGCAFPGCARPPGRCTAHHMAHWTDGGPTDVANGCLLCSYHHALVHREGWTARLARNGLPEFIPPEAYDPQRRPRQHLRYRAAAAA